ncbi:hypothetical protein [Gemmiger sp.]|uniref:hypothetical protein n=1 Tax=Gemmiger sp. TaxID=2049027 RepID=UPI003F1063B3
MKNERQTDENGYRLDEFTMRNNQLGFFLLGSHIDIEFVGKRDSQSREKVKSLVMEAYAERVKKWQ